MERMQKALPLLIVIALLAFLYVRRVEKEKNAYRGPLIPERFSRIRPGDWFRFRHQGRVMRQLVTAVRGEGDGRVVEYRIEHYGDDGEVAETEERTLTGPDPVIPGMNAEIAKGRARIVLETVEVGGKPLAVSMVYHRTGAELWCSGEVAVNGVVRVADKNGITIEPLDFGREE